MSKPGLLLLDRGNCLSLFVGKSETCASTFPCGAAAVEPLVDDGAGPFAVVVAVPPVEVLLPCRKCIPTMETTVMAAAALPPATRKVRALRRGIGACLYRSAADAGCALPSGASAGAGAAVNG